MIEIIHEWYLIINDIYSFIWGLVHVIFFCEDIFTPTEKKAPQRGFNVWFQK